METPGMEIIDFSDSKTEIGLRKTGIIKGVVKSEKTFQSGQRFKIGKMGTEPSAFQEYTFIITYCQQSGNEWEITAVLDQQQ